MNAWVVRGLGMALIHIVLRAILGIAITQWPLHGSSLRMVALVLVVIAALVWGWLDAARDRKKNPDPDTGADLTMLWLKASILGGLVAGLGSWIVNFVPDFNVTQNSLFFELTSGAAFTVLLIFVPTMLAVGVDKLLRRRTDSDQNGGGSEQRTAAAAPAAVASRPVGDSGLGSEVLSLDQQHPNAGSAQEYTGSDYTGPDYSSGDADADTTVFDAVPGTYREDTSDLEPESETSQFTDPEDVRGRD
ncbi:B-4DMT family transporter [Rhodococcus sp. NPDC058521]|uniref:B-4DMT family transporter n=1 Tax=Rhodococcus sp. NPDC058521 TaxID=3346536 RepID=UPI0036498DF0